MTTGIFLGFDFGTKRIGVAVGQQVTCSARPLLTLSNGAELHAALRKLVQTWEPQGLVVGIPVNMDGSAQPMTHAAREFAGKLVAWFNLPVFEMDERLSTRNAKDQIFSTEGFRALKKKAIDSYAAQIILQDWLEQNRI